MPPLLLNVYSLDNLGIPREQQNDLCYLPRAEWHRLMHLDCPNILLLTVEQGEAKCTLTVGDFHEQDQANIYIPYHCIGPFLEGAGAFVRRCLTTPPMATKIILQPLDTELYHCNIADAVSKVLSCWNILEKNTTLTVPCEELGGYLVDVFIKDIEPADTVLLRGEVAMELAEPLERILEWSASSASTASTASTAPLDSAIPEGIWRPVTASTVDTADTADTATATTNVLDSTVTGFIPFQGAGNRLGS